MSNRGRVVWGTPYIDKILLMRVVLIINPKVKAVVGRGSAFSSDLTGLTTRVPVKKIKISIRLDTA